VNKSTPQDPPVIMGCALQAGPRWPGSTRNTASIGSVALPPPSRGRTG